MVVFDWPTSAGGKPRLVEEYNYMNLKLNVALDPDLFLKSQYFNGK
ncbi:DUF1571 domain-containing protein [bacterium]|nr:DUF1571 domain-containing protein [bacterium]